MLAIAEYKGTKMIPCAAAFILHSKQPNNPKIHLQSLSQATNYTYIRVYLTKSVSISSHPESRPMPIIISHKIVNHNIITLKNQRQIFPPLSSS